MHLELFTYSVPQIQYACSHCMPYKFMYYYYYYYYHNYYCILYLPSGAEIQNDSYSATLSRINPKTSRVVPTAVLHNPTRFHQNHYSTFLYNLLMNKQAQTDRRTPTITVRP